MGYILVMDEEAMLCELLDDLLSDEGYDVQCSTTVSDALERTQKQQPELILFDLSLAIHADDDFIRGCRMLPGERTKLVAVSARTNLEAEALRLDLDAFIAKPF